MKDELKQVPLFAGLKDSELEELLSAPIHGDGRHGGQRGRHHRARLARLLQLPHGHDTLADGAPDVPRRHLYVRAAGGLRTDQLYALHRSLYPRPPHHPARQGHPHGDDTHDELPGGLYAAHRLPRHPRRERQAQAQSTPRGPLDLVPLYVCNTYQFNDYSRYDFKLFSEEDKRRYRDELFAIDLQNAHALGKRLVEKAKVC